MAVLAQDCLTSSVVLCIAFCHLMYYAAQPAKAVSVDHAGSNLELHRSERTTSLSVFRMKCSFKSIFARSSAVRENSIWAHSEHPCECY